MIRNKYLQIDSSEYQREKILTGFYSRLLLLFFLVTLGFNAFASDHIDGSITTEHSVADITDLFVFPSPDKSGHLILMMNVYPTVPRDGHFSDRVHYDFLLRPASISQTHSKAHFQLGKESRISCQFETPQKEHAPHWINCKSKQGGGLRTQVNNTQAKMSDNGLRIFAGSRSDPFFFNAGWASRVSTKGEIPESDNSNIMEDMNALSIVLEIDVTKYFRANSSTLMAFAAETLTQNQQKGVSDASLKRIDWIGRPEITNVSLVAHKDEKDLRDAYNKETPFKLSESTEPLYRERLRKNIDYYDNLDGKQDWSTAMADHYVNLLLNDYLVLDMSKPCGTDNYTRYLSIEKSMLKEEAVQNCGGRHPDDDVMDTIFTTFINAGTGERIRDGVDVPARPSIATFPYLVEPDDSLLGSMKAWLARLLISNFAY